jgi:outer membrane protein assembly factor BamA
MLTRLLMICVLACASKTNETLVLQADADAPLARFGCTQPAREQAAIIREAEANHYSIRRLEFLGNESISDWVLRKRMGALQEGEKFRKSNLIRSLENVSRLKTLPPVRLSDVMLRLEESDNLVDMVICFKEKKK